MYGLSEEKKRILQEYLKLDTAEQERTCWDVWDRIYTVDEHKGEPLGSLAINQGTALDPRSTRKAWAGR